MPPAKKRKTRATASEAEVPETHAEPAPAVEAEIETAPEKPASEEPAIPSSSKSEALAKAEERRARFAALQKRAQTSSQANLKEATKESHRLATDPNALHNLQRKQAIASHKLLKADVEAAGEDFERKRAWDYTIEESERWDKRMKKKDAHRDDQAFQDYRQDSRKVYKRQMRDLKPNMERYEKEKIAAIEKAAASGRLEIVETEDGPVAVDRDGTFYSTADSTDFVDHKPEKEAIDRLVEDQRKAEEARLKKQRERNKEGDDGDITYINAKNKQFNEKLGRFYNKYTAEIRDSFERGTMI